VDEVTNFLASSSTTGWERETVMFSINATFTHDVLLKNFTENKSISHEIVSHLLYCRNCNMTETSMPEVN
jgi:hypothetical protein